MNVQPTFRPAEITSFGTELSKKLYSETGQLAKAKLVNAIDLYFTPTVDIFNKSFIEIQFPKEIKLPLKKTMTVKDITDELVQDPWLPIPCEVLQSMDTKDVMCYQELKFIYKETEIQDPNDATSMKKTKIISDFAQSNRVKIVNAFEGDSLVWKEPVEVPIYIPEKPKVPPWIDPKVNYVSEDLTYVDGEWVNLEKIKIAGDKTLRDIDFNKDGKVDRHEILVYFAKYN